MKSIKNLSILLAILLIIVGATITIINMSMTTSFGLLDDSEKVSDTLNTNVTDLNLPIMVIINISDQKVDSDEKEMRLRDAMDRNMDLMFNNLSSSIIAIDDIKSSKMKMPWITDQLAADEHFIVHLNNTKDNLLGLEQIALEIDNSGALDNSNHTEELQRLYGNIQSEFDEFHLCYIDYTAQVRTRFIGILNITLTIMFLLIISLLFVIYRLISVDLKLISRTYDHIENHDFDTKNILINPIFSEEVHIQEIIKKHFRNQEIINEFKNLVSTHYVIEDIIDRLFTTFNELMAVERVGIAFYDNEANLLIAEYGVANYEKLFLEVGYKSDLSKSNLKRILDSKVGYIDNDMEKTLESKPDSASLKLMIMEGIKSNMTIPLIINDQIFGMVFFSSKVKDHFTEENYTFATSLIYEMTGALYRSYLMKVFLNKITLAFAKLVDKKDIETGDHLFRMVEYSKIIAQSLYEMNLESHPMSKRTILEIERNAAAHDIGKVGIPDYILKKPGKLTSEEYDFMKTHANTGGDIFQELNAELEYFDFNHFMTAEEIARYHHEKWDGTGYPEGLKEDSIPIVARITAVADVFDAISSKRVYKDASGFDETVEFILSQSGKHFDPTVVMAFEMKIEEIRNIYNMYNVV